VGDDPVTIATPEPSEASTPTPGQEAGPGPGDSSAPDSADAGGGETGPKRFCETQAPLTGVTDFFCADFDGTKADEGFTKTLGPDSGAAKLDTGGFFSPPASLVTTNGATLLWEKSGALPFVETDVRVRVNVSALGGVVAPSTGFVTILRLQSVDTSVELRFTAGGTVGGAGPYTGYYLNEVHCPNACGLAEAKLTNQLPTNLWTDVGLVWQKTGAVNVTFNGLAVGSLSSASTTSSSISAALGTVTSGAPVGVGRHTFDNFIVSVRR